MKKILLFIVIVLTVLFFSTVVFAAAPKAEAKKSVATIVPTVAPTTVVTTEKVAAAEVNKNDTVNISLGGETNVHYTDSQKKGLAAIDEKTGIKYGMVNVTVESSTDAKITADGTINTDLKSDDEKVKKEKSSASIIVGISYCPINSIDFRNNGLEIKERPEDSANFKLSAAYRINDVEAVSRIRLGSIVREGLVNGNSLGKNKIYSGSFMIRGYKEIFSLDWFAGVGLNYTYLDGDGLGFGGVRLETEGAGISPSFEFGVEKEIEKNINVKIGASYDKRNISNPIPGSDIPLSSGEQGVSGFVEVNYSFPLK